jgi:tetratricopeptide (TPR) repeat protein
MNNKNRKIISQITFVASVIILTFLAVDVYAGPQAMAGIGEGLLILAGFALLQIGLIVLWFVVHIWPKESSKTILVIRIIIDLVVILYSAATMLFIRSLSSMHGYALDELGAAMLDYPVRLFLFFIVITCIVSIMNTWITTLERSSRVLVHFFQCLLIAVGILMPFMPNYSGPVARWFVNSKILFNNSPVAYVNYGFEYNNDLFIVPKEQDSADYIKKIMTLGSAHYFKGQYEKTMPYYKKIIEMFPSYPLAYSNLSWVLSTCPEIRLRNGTRALELAEKSIELCERERETLNQSDNFCRDRLFVKSAALAELGEFDEAIKILRENQLMFEKKDPILGYLISKHDYFISSFMSKKPWREIRREGRFKTKHMQHYETVYYSRTLDLVPNDFDFSTQLKDAEWEISFNVRKLSDN